jgi:hypothetical protein
MAHSCNIRISVIWHLTLSLGVSQHFEGSYCCHLQGQAEQELLGPLGPKLGSSMTLPAAVNQMDSNKAAPSARLEYTASCFINEYAMNELY